MAELNFQYFKSSVEESGKLTGHFLIESLEAGQWLTIGNALCRVLLSNLEGTAITGIKIPGVAHEFSTIPNVREDVLEIFLNLKQIVLKSEKQVPIFGKVSINGPGVITASSIKFDDEDIEIVNPNQYIASFSGDDTLTFDIKVEKGIGYQFAEQANTNDNMDFLAIDAVFMPVLKVNYKISDLKKYALNVEDPEIKIRQATESALRHVVGENVMDDLLTSGAAAISSGILLRLEEYLDIYDAGIAVQQVNIEQRQPPAEVIDSFRDVVAAREDKERLRNEAEKYALSIVPQARGEAQRQLQDAEAYKEKVIAVAEGEADRFTALLTEYQKAPEVTRERLYIDTLEEVMSSSTKVMIDVEGGNNLLYLPLDQLMKKEEEDDE